MTRSSVASWDEDCARPGGGGDALDGDVGVGGEMRGAVDCGEAASAEDLMQDVGAEKRR